MINPKLIFLFMAAIAALCWACKPSDTPDRTAEEITTAIQQGRYDNASSLADGMMNRRDSGLDTMRVERLCMLAVSMVRLSEHSERGEDYAAFALKSYQQALNNNPAATQQYVSEMTSDDYRYISLLNQLLRPVNAREAGVVYSINDDGEDSTVDSIPEHPHHD